MAHRLARRVMTLGLVGSLSSLGGPACVAPPDDVSNAGGPLDASIGDTSAALRGDDSEEGATPSGPATVGETVAGPGEDAYEPAAGPERASLVPDDMHADVVDSGAADAGPASPSIGAFALYATEAIELNSGALVTGCSVGVENTTGPFLSGGAAAYSNSGATIQSTQTLYVYSVYLNSGASLGPVDTDHIMGNSGATYGTVSTFPAMPAPPTLPAATAGTTSVTLNSGASKTLAAGAYASVTVNSGATLSLTGGTYVFSSLTMNSGSTLAVTAATTLSITGSASFNSGSVTGPASGSGLTAKALVLYLDTSSGIDLSSGAEVQALFVATHALVTVNTAKFTGAIAAAQVLMNSGATVTCQDGFGSLACPAGSCVIGGACVASGATNGTNTCETCQPSVSTTAYSPVTNGASCTNANECDLESTCQAGACTAGSTVTCTAPASCYTAGTCNPATGTCSTATLNAGFCYIGGACVASGATNGNDTCETCQPSLSTSAYSSVTNGTTCNDGNVCTDNYTCQAGACAGSNPITCTALDQCHVTGTCNPSTGVCSNPTATNGTSCNDGNACDSNDTCQTGVCVAGTTVVCTASDQCRCGGDVQPEHGAVLEPDGRQRNELQRRERVRPERHVPGGGLHRREPGHVHGAGPVLRRGQLQHGDRRVLQSARGERYHVPWWRVR